MLAPIPNEWTEAVIRILRTHDSRFIEWTLPARQRWEADTFGAWNYEAYEAMMAALGVAGVQGNATTSEAGQLATYEFQFWHRSKPMYGKIALKNDRVRILILSAHKAARPTLSP